MIFERDVVIYVFVHLGLPLNELKAHIHLII